MKSILCSVKRRLKLFLLGINPQKCGYLDESAYIGKGFRVYNQKNLFMYEDTDISENAVIMNTRANFVMKKWSGAAVGLTVITGNHMSIPGMSFKDVTDAVKDKYDCNHQLDKDVIIEEDSWIGANTTILSGVTIGRGCVIGAGSVVRYSTPPYSVVAGNPAKVVGFRFLNPDEIIEHEKALYSEEDRLSREIIEKNFDKYLLKRKKEIVHFLRL